jgi:hypothetical protein
MSTDWSERLYLLFEQVYPVQAAKAEVLRLRHVLAAWEKSARVADEDLARAEQLGRVEWGMDALSPAYLEDVLRKSRKNVEQARNLIIEAEEKLDALSA